jgi:transcriptional regulator with XRE-family HTH domain
MFWEIYSNLCASRKSSPNRVAKELSISSGAVTEWKKGRTPQSSTLQKIADYFGVSVDYLLGKEEKPAAEGDELNEYLEELKNRPEMRMLFSLAKGATKEDVERAVAIIEALRKNEDG